MKHHVNHALYFFMLVIATIFIIGYTSWVYQNEKKTDLSTLQIFIGYRDKVENLDKYLTEKR